MPFRRAATLAALLAVAACGPDDGRAGRGDAPRVAPRPADGPHRAAPPAPPATTRPSAELLRALDVLADPAAGDDARAAARAEVLAGGATAAEALVDWLRFDWDDPRGAAAREMLPELGRDAVRPLVAALAPVPEDADDERGDWRRPGAAIEILADIQATWSSSELAAEVAAAALAAAEGQYKNALGLVLLAGPASAPLAGRVLAHLQSDDGAEWMNYMDDRPADAAIVLASVAADLVPFLVPDDGRWEGAKAILSAMESPPEAAVLAILARAGDPEAEARPRALHVAAAWAGVDARCAELARRVALDADPDLRLAVLEGWAGGATLSPDDALLAARSLGIDAPLWRAATEVLQKHLSARDDCAAIVERALDASGGDEAVALCRAVTVLREDVRAALVPTLARRLASPDAAVRLEACRAIDTAPSWGAMGQAWDAAVAHLDDPDPGVRAWAALLSYLADDSPDEKIAATARPLVASLTDGREIVAALRALAWADAPAAWAEARRLLAHPDPDVRARAEWIVREADDRAAAPDGAVADVVERLRSLDGREAAENLDLLLRMESGVAPAVAWLGDHLTSAERDDVHHLLYLWLDGSAPQEAAIPALRRLAAREGFTALGEAALAWFEPDPETAVRRFAAVLPHLLWNEREHLVHPRLTDLGAAGAALLVRSGGSSSHWTAEAVVRDEPAAVRGAIAELSASRDPADRETAARWAGVFGPGEALPLLASLVRDDVMNVAAAALQTAHELAAEHADLAPHAAAWSVALLQPCADAPLRDAAAFLADAPALPAGGAAALRAVATHPDFRLVDADARSAAAAALLLHDAGDADAVGVVLDRFRRGLGYDGAAWTLCARAIGRAAGSAGSAGPAARRAGPVLARALVCSWNERCRAALIEAAAALGPDAAPCVPVLRTALVRDLGGDGWRTREFAAAAARALGAIGPAAAAAVPDLRRLARDPKFRDAAESAIRAIEAAPR